MDDDGDAGREIAPGRCTLTGSLPPRPIAQRRTLPSGARELELGPVQRKITQGGGGDDVGADAMADAAARGLATPAGPLPYADQVQRSFGQFDVRAVPAHVGPSAAAAAGDMRAEAFAAGGHVVLPPGASLHTVAHEAAHVVQQRSGVARKSSAPGDAYERHADAVADRVVAGESAEALLAQMCGLGTVMTPPGSVQRKIRWGGKDLPTKWADVPPIAKKAADAAMQEAADQLGLAPDDDELIDAWERVAKGKTPYALDDDEVADALVASHARSQRAAAGAAARKSQQQGLVGPLCEHDDSLEFHPSAQNPRLEAEQLAKFKWDPATTKEAQTQTHMSTLLLEHLGGVEVQASLAKDGSDAHVASNKDGVNKQIAQTVGSRDALQRLAAQVAVGKHLEELSRKAAMADRVIRHAMKLFSRIEAHLGADATITVPGGIVDTPDGQHAEIRIERADTWSSDTHHMPTGTKYPCMGCKLYFDSKGHVTGVRMGPMWITGAALSTQLREQLAEGRNIGGLTDDDVDTVAALLLEQFKQLGKGVQMGHSRTKAGKYTTDTMPDSESELDDEEYERVQAEMVLAAKSGPLTGGSAAGGKARAAPKKAGGTKRKPPRTGEREEEDDDDEEEDGLDARERAKPAAKIAPTKMAKTAPAKATTTGRGGGLAKLQAARAQAERVKEIDRLCGEIRAAAGSGAATKFWRTVDRALNRARGDIGQLRKVMAGLDRAQMKKLFDQAKIDFELVLGYEDALTPEALQAIMAALLDVLTVLDAPAKAPRKRRDSDDDDDEESGGGRSGFGAASGSPSLIDVGS